MLLIIVGKLKNLDHKCLLSGLRSNWFIPVSAVFFLLMNTGLPAFNNLPVNAYYSLIPSILLILLLSLICPPFKLLQDRTGLAVRMISLVSAVGICWSTWKVLQSVPYVWGGDTYIQRLIYMVLAIPFAYVVNLLFWDKLGAVLKDLIRSADIRRTEWIVYSLIFLLFCSFVAYCFLSSQAFYGTPHQIDIVYTSDSPKLLKNNAFIVLDHIENDFRQPLFAVFSAPFMGIPCLLGNVIPNVPAALFIAVFQLVLLLVSLIMFACELDLSRLQRICFVTLTSCTYTFILFSIMIDQYVIAFFWLVLTIYLMNRNKKDAYCASFAASGTLLVSGALVPFILYPQKPVLRSLKEWILKMVCYGMDFILLILLSDRFHILWNSVKNLGELSKFTGKSIGLSERILQYINFTGSCIIAPEALVKRLDGDYNGWQLAEVTTVNYVGAAVLVVAVISFIVTRRSKISRIAFGWILLSAVVLIGVGWGIYENGLILYSLYFGWPFWILIFNLLFTIEKKAKTKLIVPIVSAVSGVLLLCINIPEIIRLVEFAINEYPA